MAARPNEIRAVVDLLTEPANDVTALAKQIINRVDELRQDRTDYAVVAQAPGAYAYGYGLYATYAQAAKAIEGGKIPAIDGTRFFVLPVRSQHAAQAAWDKADEGGLSPEAKKAWEIARNGGQAANRRKGRAA